MRPANAPAPSRATASRSAASSAHKSRGANSGGWFVGSAMAAFCARPRPAFDGEKKPRRSGVSLAALRVRSGDRDHASGLRSLRTLHDVVADALAFLQAAKALGVDRRVMHEHI